MSDFMDKALAKADLGGMSKPYNRTSSRPALRDEAKDYGIDIAARSTKFVRAQMREVDKADDAMDKYINRVLDKKNQAKSAGKPSAPAITQTTHTSTAQTYKGESPKSQQASPVFVKEFYVVINGVLCLCLFNIKGYSEVT